MKKWLYGSMCLLVVLFIWHNSLQDAAQSDARSLAVTYMVQQTANVLGFHGTGLINDTIIRKCAHVCEYGLLGSCLYLLMRRICRRRRGIRAVGVGTLIALIDEFLQLFSPGRGAQLRDVGIDMAGLILGCFVIQCLCMVYHAYKRRGF